MRARKPIRVLMTRRYYAVTSYDEKPDGQIVAKTKHDVSSDIEAILAAERERIAQAIEGGYLGPDFGRQYDGRESPHAALANSYDEGLEYAAHIARTPT